MPKYVTLEIKESLSYLKSHRNKETNHRKKTRIQSLILTKKKKFKRRSDLAIHLGVGIASLNRWTSVYNKSGLDAMLTISNGGIRRNSVPTEVHQGLKDKVHNSELPLSGCQDAVLWVKETFGIDIKYNTLRSYLKRNFKTKLKEPRKSHYKKNDQATEAFKKTTLCIE